MVTAVEKPGMEKAAASARDNAKMRIWANIPIIFKKNENIKIKNFL